MSAVHPLDSLRTAWLGVVSRPQRAALAALGVLLGIAALVVLTGVSDSGRAALLDRLDDLGADLVVVEPATGPDREPVPLPDSAPAMLAHQDGVLRVGVLETAPEHLGVYRSDLVSEAESGGIGVAVARPDVLDAVGATVAAGRWFDEGSRSLPVTVLGASAADRLGVTRPGDRVFVGGAWYGVIGILGDPGLAESLDTSAILADRWVRSRFGGDRIGDVSMIFVRAEPGRAAGIEGSLAAAASPGSPFVRVSRPAALGDAHEAADDSLSRLGIVLAAIALLVGGAGIANTMIVTVLERRGEIGLRRALGARPGNIASQFLVEAMMIAGLGGAAGSLLGVLIAIAVAVGSGQPVAIPVLPVLAGPAIAVAVGALAGLQPALRAATLPPTVALRSV